MVEIDLTPTYRGVWVKQERDFQKYVLFSMWKKEKRKGKILEMHHGEIVEADAEILLDNGIQIEFIQKYKNSKADLLKEDIKYFGSGNGIGFYNGEWKGKNSKGEERRGEFYLADVKEDWAVKELERIVGGLCFFDLERKVISL